MSRRWSLVLGCTVALAGPFPAAAQQRYALQTWPVVDVEATLTYSAQTPKLWATEWIMFLARPPELPGQTGVQSRIEPAGRAIAELGGFGRPLWEVRVAARTRELEKGVTVRATHNATLHGRKLVALPAAVPAPPVAPLAEGERATYVEATRYYDFRSEAFQDWLTLQRLHRGNGEGDVDFARRVLLAVRKKCTYKFPEPAWKATEVLLAGRSHCGGLSVMFIAALRANGIPARATVGRWAQSARPGEGQYHVKAEFYAHNVGWVPVEVSGAVSFANTNIDESIGNERGDFVTLNLDWDLVVDTVYFGRKTIDHLQLGAYWVKSSAGTFDGSGTTDDWQVRTSRAAPMPFRSQGTAQLRNGNYREAIDLLSRAIRQDPLDSLAYNERAVALSFLNRDAEAVQDFTAALAINDRAPITYRGRGSAYLRQQKYNEALADFNRAIQLDPNYILAYLGRSTVYRKLGKTAEADEDDRRAAQLQQAKGK